MAKVKNIGIDIKIGNKEYKLRNLILNTLLNSYINKLVSQYDQMRTVLGSCLLKFSPLQNYNADSLIRCDSFDICISTSNIASINSKNKIVNKYVYSSENEYIYDYSKETDLNIKIKDYIGQKIYALGFSFAGTDGTLNIDAILDVSNYEIYIESGEEILITRIDEVATDGIFTSLHEKVNFPVHLSGRGVEGILAAQELWDTNHLNSYTIYNNAYAKLTNFGLSNVVDEIELEYDITDNYEINDNVFTIKNIWSPKGLYPSNELYPDDNLYPDLEPFNYLILRFKLFQKVAAEDATYENQKEIIKFTGAEYLQAIPLDKIGNVNLNIKYERG